MRRIAVVALLVTAIIGIAIERPMASAGSRPAAVCGDPTARCWTQGRPWYQGITRTWGFGVLPNWVIPTGAGVGFLNTGPNIPHLVVVVNARGSRILYSPAASLHDSRGSHPLAPRPLHAPRPFLAWDLGPVQDGAVVWFRVRVTPTKHPTWAWQSLYATLAAGGGVSWQTPVHPELAPLHP